MLDKCTACNTDLNLNKMTPEAREKRKQELIECGESLIKKFSSTPEHEEIFSEMLSSIRTALQLLKGIDFNEQTNH